MGMRVEKLHELVAAVCPINGVNSNHEIDFKDESTKAQRDYALAVAAAYTPAFESSEADADEKAATLNTVRALRDTVLARLNGIQLDAMLANDTATVSAISTTKQQLKDITAWPDVVSATDAATVKTAFIERYYSIVAQMEASYPYAVTAFGRLDL